MGGDVKDVKPGFARNYLLPKQLAVPATQNALQRVERLKRESDKERIQLLADMEILAKELNGTQVNIEMRAGVSGRLYGSVTNVVIASELSTITKRVIDRRTIELSEPLREVGAFDVKIRIHSEVDASVKVVIYPVGSDPMEILDELESNKTASETEEIIPKSQNDKDVSNQEEIVTDEELESPDLKTSAPADNSEK